MYLLLSFFSSLFLYVFLRWLFLSLCVYFSPFSLSVFISCALVLFVSFPLSVFLSPSVFLYIFIGSLSRWLSVCL